MSRGAFASRAPRVAVINVGMGNLFSIIQACRYSGLDAKITGDPDQIVEADGIILPGVGAFGEAMKVLIGRGLDEAVRSIVKEGRPLLGICLGLQLLMSSSTEFGHHKGLGLVPGSTELLKSERVGGRWTRKVPNVGWDEVRPTGGNDGLWQGTLMKDVRPGSFMYFVHSYVVRPEDTEVIKGVTSFGDDTFCSVLAKDNVFAVQFHPERSGPAGLRIYEAFAGKLRAL